MEKHTWIQAFLRLPIAIVGKTFSSLDLKPNLTFMKRRIALKQLAVAAAAAWVLPGCVADAKKVSIALNRLQISGDEEDLLAQLAETLIPEADTPGGRTVGAHHFTLVMVDDCMAKPDQEKFLKGMRAFDGYTKQLSGTTFAKASAEERAQILERLQAQQESAPDAVAFFYKHTRRYILQGYTESQHFLTTVKPYQLVPGPDFKGCVPVNQPVA